MLRELNSAARAFLAEPRFAVLATVAASGRPQQTVMWYLIDGDTILFNTKKGRIKELNLGRDPRVSLCIAEGYRYITVRGRVDECTDPTIGQADIKRLAERYHGPEKAARMVVTQFSKEERVTYRVKLDNVLVYGFDE